MTIAELLKVKQTNNLVQLSKDQFLSDCHCERCNRSSLTVIDNDDGKNMLGFSLCLSCQEE
ncbi:hypothetical protein D1B31_17755 [Neobacillus notoginsengisoli]|uniref:Uncharacterized protein n=1 Tax=Neobacillus notoginsengisoli TaxID=1578198 RepID=A0A417YPY6_9BACI|nr:hypothetical protein D1B31_17755 [Neobacillus notoginsengisoli]